MTTSPLTPAEDGAAGGHPRPAGRPPLVALALAVEDATALDGAVAALRPQAQRLVAHPTARHLLLGRQLGHALHPLLTDAPLGAWLSANVVDLALGRSGHDAGRLLAGLGVLTAVPTALSGAAEWSHTAPRDSRTGLVHAASNTVALALWTGSWLARRRGRHGSGALLGLAGTAAAGVGGFFGAHLAIARNVGTRDAVMADSFPATGADSAGQGAVTAD